MMVVWRYEKKDLLPYIIFKHYVGFRVFNKLASVSNLPKAVILMIKKY